jgi:ABC-type amino acid transport substrate-binding protein
MAALWGALSAGTGATAVPPQAALPPTPPATITVRFAPEADYGPFVFRAEDGSIQGLSVDVLHLAARRGGLQVVTLPAAPLAVNLAAARRGQVDVLTSLRPTPERAQFLDFSAPYVQVPAVVISLLSRPEPDLAALAGQAVAVGQGYAVESHVRQRFPAVRWQAVPDDLQGLQRLRRGEVVAVVADVASVHYLMERQGWTDLRLGRPVGFDYPLSLAWRKDLPAVGAALQRGLLAITPQEREALRVRWMSAAAEPVESTRERQWLIGAALALTLLGLLGWWALLARRHRRVRAAPYADDSQAAAQAGPPSRLDGSDRPGEG